MMQFRPPPIILSDSTGSTAEVLLYGGQVVSFKNERQEEMLFVTNKAAFKASDKAIRGGVSICFPQFSNLGSPELLGFARDRLWSLDDSPSLLPPVNNQSTVDLLLKSTEEDLKTWPYRFELRLRISLTAGKLTFIPRVLNTDSKSFSFSFALCNYLSVSDISKVRVEGLETHYFDNLLQKERYTEQEGAITFDGEIDRVYLSTATKIAIIDHEKNRTFVLCKDGMPDTVVWNPWDKKAKPLPDMGHEDYEDYKTMVCVGSAIENQILLKPLEEWKACQSVTISSSGQLDKVLLGMTENHNFGFLERQEVIVQELFEELKKADMAIDCLKLQVSSVMEKEALSRHEEQRDEAAAVEKEALSRHEEQRDEAAAMEKEALSRHEEQRDEVAAMEKEALSRHEEQRDEAAVMEKEDNFQLRRKNRPWTINEEDGLRMAVEKYGIGNWQGIKKKYPTKFVGRTNVDLKDKWRNMGAKAAKAKLVSASED